MKLIKYVVRKYNNNIKIYYPIQKKSRMNMIEVKLDKIEKEKRTKIFMYYEGRRNSSSSHTNDYSLVLFQNTFFFF